MKAGHTIVQVYSPTLAHARSLAVKTRSVAVHKIAKIDRQADIYLMCVSDRAIPLLARKLKLDQGLVLHTSGTTSLETIRKMGLSQGVLYPLQTFSLTKKVDLQNITWLIEGSDRVTEKKVKTLALGIGGKIKRMDSQARLKVHLAAVFACNFSNHCYALAAKLLAQEGIALDILMPLIEETTEKLKFGSPVKMQTGPAVRGDQVTLKKHIQVLKKEKELKQLYILMSRSIAHLSR
jgi:predicted short-subunit dehydrogenase-like oxidoreductase (DUF2520 family)